MGFDSKLLAYSFMSVGLAFALGFSLGIGLGYNSSRLQVEKLKQASDFSDSAQVVFWREEALRAYESRIP